MGASREQLTAWRTKCSDGTITRDEYRDLIAAMREDRYASRPQPKVKKPRKAKAVKAAPPVGDLINQVTGSDA